jgi:hypothetical protein
VASGCLLLFKEVQFKSDKSINHGKRGIAHTILRRAWHIQNFGVKQPNIVKIIINVELKKN